MATVTSTAPADPAGDVTVIWLSLFTVKAVAAAAPNFTAVAAVKPLPVIFTLVPPAVEPLDGEIAVTAGTGATKLKSLAAVPKLVPSAVVTVTLTPPKGEADSAGVTAVIWVSLTTVKDVAATDPKFTAVAPVKPVPPMVTVVPPAVAPLFGEIPEMLGAVGAV